MSVPTNIRLVIAFLDLANRFNIKPYGIGYGCVLITCQTYNNIIWSGIMILAHSKMMRANASWRKQLHPERWNIMMTSSSGNIFRVTGHLCGEFTGDTKASDAELWCFFDLRLNKRLSKQRWGWLFETPPWSLWRHCYVANLIVIVIVISIVIVILLSLSWLLLSLQYIRSYLLHMHFKLKLGNYLDISHKKF